MLYCFSLMSKEPLPFFFKSFSSIVLQSFTLLIQTFHVMFWIPLSFECSACKREESSFLQKPCDFIFPAGRAEAVFTVEPTSDLFGLDFLPLGKHQSKKTQILCPVCLHILKIHGAQTSLSSESSSTHSPIQHLKVRKFFFFH